MLAVTERRGATAEMGDAATDEETATKREREAVMGEWKIIPI
jgi:hypothetical protein